MIKSLKIINFRNFLEKEIFFDEEKNFIIWENWKWKTNILEAISTITSNSIIWLYFDDLVNINEELFFIEINTKTDKISISFDKKDNKKKYFVNSKNTTKAKFKNIVPKSVFFSPMSMNMFYLWPSLRRDFIDNILMNSYIEYEKILRDYKNILKNRNKLLKNIGEKKSTKQEIVFWDENFTNQAIKIYNYRFKIIEYIKQNIHNLKPYFNWKINKIEFLYKTKINLENDFSQENIKKEIKDYLNNNLDRDIILKKTHIWPHIDDFDIIIDNISLTKFASRWETKSIIIWLKLMEVAFIEKLTWKNPILLIDDLLSELDEIHKNLLLENINWNQVFIASINKISEENNIFI